MKVLLHADVPKLGHFGDVVEVAEGYGRNYLLPQRLAVEPTSANVKAIQEERARQAEVRRLAREELLKVAEKVKGAQVTIVARANEQGHLFGSVTEETIAAALREQGFEVQNKHVVMNEHFRMLGSYDVKLRFDVDIEVDVKVGVVQPTDQNDDAQREQPQADE
jgi:large subunit ribosomal protein L9